MPDAPHRHSVTIAGTECTLETGRIACHASGAVLARAGDNVILATVVAAENARDGVDFLPLQIEYREKLAAAGRIPGSFQRREGRITDHEVLTSRLIDRTLRSLFPKGYHHEVQVQVTVMSAEPTSDLTSLALLAAGAAIRLSPVPAAGPAAGLRVVRSGGGWHAFASSRQRAEATLDFVVSAGPDGLVMVEGEAAEVDAGEALAALETATGWLRKACKAIDALATSAGARRQPPPPAPTLPTLDAETDAALQAALQTTDKTARRSAIAAARTALLDTADAAARGALAAAFDARLAQSVREAILAEGRRLDGRAPADIRPIWGETGWLPRAHGSAIFTRGETQALCSCTLGTAEDAQRIESLAGSSTEHFLLHYGFPPYSVGEVRPLRGPGRREIGHGHLARRGLHRVMPSFDDYPYTVRVESEISMSNGSSSMATVCGGCMAMLDAGVPLRAMVAGIAMGLVTDGTRTRVLSDILGDEDHLGDMDFKVVGTEHGITALQLDNKVGGLSAEQLGEALAQATDGLLHILAAMRSVIDAPATEPSPHAPRAERTAIMPSAIGNLVGPRGANIRAIEASTGARVTVDDDAIVRVYAATPRAARAAMRLVHQAAGVVRARHYYRAVVTGVRDFGAFARINQVNEGLIPSEELGPAAGPGKPPVAEGDEIVVQVLGLDARGRLRLSRAAAAGVAEESIED